MKIPFNKPFLSPNELKNINRVYVTGHFSGDGEFTKKCQEFIERHLLTKKALLTHSCTAALEMMTILADIRPKDEVIMASYTFSSTANAVVLRGGTPVFIDIREDTLNLDEKRIEAAITKKTKAIMPMHYAGVGCDMKKILQIAKKHKLLVLEDAAQGLLSSVDGKNLGTIGDMGALSFHETKNVTAGEGGMLLINNKRFIQRAEIIREKGTNRNQFLRGQVDKYTWVDIGSSYLPAELVAAFLLSQLQQMEKITKKRVAIWNQYHSQLEKLEKSGSIRRPIVPVGIEHSGHLYYILVESLKVRTALSAFLKKNGIPAYFHYIPLHNSPAGKRFGRKLGQLNVTEDVADRLLRLPLYYDMTEKQIEFVANSIERFFKK